MSTANLLAVKSYIYIFYIYTYGEKTRVHKNIYVKLWDEIIPCNDNQEMVYKEIHAQHSFGIYIQDK